MNTDTVRMNITLPKALVQALNKYAGPRKRSQHIAEAVSKYLDEKEKEKLESELEEGYRAAAKEGLSLSRDFESADMEGWDDY